MKLHFRNWHWFVHTKTWQLMSLSYKKTWQLMSLSYEIPNHNYVLQHWFTVIQSILKNIQPKLHAPAQREGNFWFESILQLSHYRITVKGITWYYRYFFKCRCVIWNQIHFCVHLLVISLMKLSLFVESPEVWGCHSQPAVMWPDQAGNWDVCITIHCHVYRIISLHVFWKCNCSEMSWCYCHSKS